MQWAPTNAAFDDNMNFINNFEPSLDFNAVPGSMSQNDMSFHTMNPYLVTRDWGNEDYFQNYCNPTLI